MDFHSVKFEAYLCLLFFYAGNIFSSALRVCIKILVKYTYSHVKKKVLAVL